MEDIELAQTMLSWQQEKTELYRRINAQKKGRRVAAQRARTSGRTCTASASAWRNAHGPPCRAINGDASRGMLPLGTEILTRTFPGRDYSRQLKSGLFGARALPCQNYR